MSEVTTKLPGAFRRIHLQLAREPGHPAGDPDERYILIAPLQDDGRIDGNLARDYRDACRVVRDHEGETAVGHLVHGPRGVWRFEYDISGQATPERGFRLGDEVMREGEYVAIIRDDGEHPYRVAAVQRV